MALTEAQIAAFNTRSKAAAEKLMDKAGPYAREMERAIKNYDSKVNSMVQMSWEYDYDATGRPKAWTYATDMFQMWEVMISGGKWGDGKKSGMEQLSPSAINLSPGSKGWLTNDEIEALETKNAAKFDDTWRMVCKKNHGGWTFAYDPNNKYGTHGGWGGNASPLNIPVNWSTGKPTVSTTNCIQTLVMGNYSEWGRKSPHKTAKTYYAENPEVLEAMRAGSGAHLQFTGLDSANALATNSSAHSDTFNIPYDWSDDHEYRAIRFWWEWSGDFGSSNQYWPFFNTIFQPFYMGYAGSVQSGPSRTIVPGQGYKVGETSAEWCKDCVAQGTEGESRRLYYNAEGTDWGFSSGDTRKRAAHEFCLDSITSLMFPKGRAGGSYEYSDCTACKDYWAYHFGGHSIDWLPYAADDDRAANGKSWNQFKCMLSDPNENSWAYGYGQAKAGTKTHGERYLIDMMNAYPNGWAVLKSFYHIYIDVWFAIGDIIEASNKLAELDFEYLRAIWEWANSAQAGRDVTDPYAVLGHYAKAFVVPNLEEQTPEEAARRQEQSNEATKPTITQRLGVWQREMMYKEQCYLLSHIFPLTDYARQFGIKNLPYVEYSFTDEEKQDPRYQVTTGGNACLLVDADPFALINKLTQDPSQQILFDLQTKDISTLQPMVRLFKVEFDDSGQEFETEYVFDSYERSLSSLLSTVGKRGTGVGLKKFSFTYDGHDPFAAKKSIKARLEIFANSFDELLKERDYGKTTLGGNRVGSKFKYVELALKTANTKNRTTDSDDVLECRPTKTQANDNLSKLNFRLKAVVGWAAPPGKTNHMSPGAKDAVYDSFVTLNLTPTVHDFKFDELGRVTLTINYLAFVEDFFDQPEFSIFADVNTLAKQELRKLSYKYHSSKCNSEQLNDIKQAHMDRVNIEKRTNIQSIMGRLLTEDKIRYVDVHYQDIRGFIRRGPFYRPSEKLKIKDSKAHIDTLKLNIEAAIDRFDPDNDPENEKFLTDLGRNWADEDMKKEFKKKFKGSVGALGPNAAGLAYFYVRDLVDVVLRNVEEVLEKLPAAMGGLHDSGDLSTEPPEKYELNKCDLVLRKEQIKNYATLFKKFRIVLGPLEIVNHTAGTEKPPVAPEASDPTGPATRGSDPGGPATRADYEAVMGAPETEATPTSKIVNLGDIPVSIKYFVEFLGDRMTKKDQSSYPLAKFLNDFFKNLLTNFLNDDTCFDVNIKQKIRLNQAALTSYRREAYKKDGAQLYWNADEITRGIWDLAKANSIDITTPASNGAKPTDYYLDIDAVEKPVLNISGQRKTPDGGNPGVFLETNYLTYFAGRTSPKEKMKGDLEQDKEAGIFHYVLGKNRGIIKDIKLSKTDSKGLPEVRFEQDGYDGLKQLRVVYDVDVDTYLNVKTFPGSYIFVDPRGFAPNTNLEADSELNLTEYGIGGYCMIIRSTHEFGAGLAKSSLHAKWVHDTNNNLDKKADNERQSYRGANDGDGCSSTDVGHTKRKSQQAAEKAQKEAGDTVGSL